MEDSRRLGAAKERRTGRGYGFVLRLILALGFLAFLLWKARPWRADELGELNVEIIVGVLAINLLVPFLVGLRSQAVLRDSGYPRRLAEVAPISLFGFAAGMLTPARAGEVLRAVLYKQRLRVPLRVGTATILYERSFSFYLLCITTLAFGMIVLPVPLWVGSLMALGIFSLVCLPVIGYTTGRRAAAYLWNKAGLGGVALSGSRLGRLVSAAREGETALRPLFSSWRTAAVFIALTLVFFTISVTQFWLIARGLGSDLDLQAAWLAWGIFAIAAVMSLLPAGLGLADGVLAIVLVELGIGLETAVAIAVLSRLLINLPQGLGALAAYAFVSFGTQEQRRRDSLASQSVEAPRSGSASRRVG